MDNGSFGRFTDNFIADAVGCFSFPSEWVLEISYDRHAPQLALEPGTTGVAAPRAGYLFNSSQRRGNHIC